MTAFEFVFALVSIVTSLAIAVLTAQYAVVTCSVVAD